MTQAIRRWLRGLKLAHTRFGVVCRHGVAAPPRQIGDGLRDIDQAGMKLAAGPIDRRLGRSCITIGRLQPHRATCVFGDLHGVLGPEASCGMS